MYDDFDLDYTCEDNSFNYDDEYYEDLDENYQRAHTDYQELAYTHYAWCICICNALDYVTLGTFMCDVLLYLFLAHYGIRSQEGVCQWSNCHSKTWQALLQKITDIIFRQGEWRSLFSSATPHPLFFVTLIIIHILIGINMKYDTFFSGTVWVAHGSQCDIIKVWKGWFPFTGHKIYLFFSHKL